MSKLVHLADAGGNPILSDIFGEVTETGPIRIEIAPGVEPACVFRACGEAMTLHREWVDGNLDIERVKATRKAG